MSEPKCTETREISQLKQRIPFLSTFVLVSPSMNWIVTSRAFWVHSTGKAMAVVVLDGMFTRLSPWSCLEVVKV